MDFRNMNPKSLALYIDHTVLKPDTPISTVKKICDEALQYQFASVCVNPCFTAYVAEKLKGSNVLTCCVIGFPFGAQTPEAKAFEARDAAANGAEEIDMVINVGAIKSGDWDLVKRDVDGVVKAAGKAAVKVILETCLLNDEEKVKACQICKEVGAAFVKTSTGFSTGGATVEDIRLMRETVGPDMGVKASGGIRTYQDAVAMLEAGASRIGASAGISIISGK